MEIELFGIVYEVSPNPDIGPFLIVVVIFFLLFGIVNKIAEARDPLSDIDD